MDELDSVRSFLVKNGIVPWLSHDAAQRTGIPSLFKGEGLPTFFRREGDGEVALAGAVRDHGRLLDNHDTSALEAQCTQLQTSMTSMYTDDSMCAAMGASFATSMGTAGDSMTAALPGCTPDLSGFTASINNCQDITTAFSTYCNSIVACAGGHDGHDHDDDGHNHGAMINDDTCMAASDGDCDDGGPGAEFQFCEVGSDQTDCGTRADGTPGSTSGSGGQMDASSCAAIQAAVNEACGGLYGFGLFILVYPSLISFLALIAFSCVCCKMGDLDKLPSDQMGGTQMPVAAGVPVTVKADAV